MIGMHFLLISVDPAFLIFKTFLANSIRDNCIPKQIPKKGILFVLANLIDCILPSVPLLPKPPGIKIPLVLDSLFLICEKVNFSESILVKLTLVLFAIPP